MGGSPWLQLIPFAIVAPLMWVFGRITKRMGRSAWWGVVWCIPGPNVLFLIWIAFAEWPVETEVTRLRESVAILQGIASSK